MKKYERICIYSLLGIFLVVSLFLDLPITQGLYAPTNLFGQIGEMSAEIPAYLILIFACALIFRFHPHFKNKIADVFLTIGIGMVTLFVSYYGGSHFLKLLNRVTCRVGENAFPAYFKLIYGMAFLGLGAPWAWLVSKNSAKEAFVFGLFVLALYASLLVTMQGLKMLWLRPRYRTLVALFGEEAAGSYWKPVWSINGWWSFSSYSPEALGPATVNNAMASLGISQWGKEEFYSFPSGHTMNFIGAMSICMVSSFAPKLKGKEIYVRIGFYVLGVCVALSRIVRGAHNLSDVTFGFLLGTFGFDMISTYFLPFLEKVTNKKATI